MDDDLVGAVQFAHARREFADRDQLRAVEVADVPLERLAHVEQHEFFPRIEFLLQIDNGHRRDGRFGGLGGGGLRDAAELLVVDQLGDRRVGRTDRALGIFAELELAELELERVEVDEPTDERFADAHDEFDRLDRLHDADDAGQHAQHAAFRAARHHARRRRFGKHAAVARPAKMRREHGALSVEAEDRAVDVRLFQENADVVREIARGKIVGAVDDDVIRLDDSARVLRSEIRVVQIHLHVRVHLADAVARAVQFLAAHVLRAV